LLGKMTMPAHKKGERGKLWKKRQPERGFGGDLVGAVVPEQESWIEQRDPSWQQGSARREKMEGVKKNSSLCRGVKKGDRSLSSKGGLVFAKKGEKRGGRKGGGRS